MTFNALSVPAFALGESDLTMEITVEVRDDGEVELVSHRTITTWLTDEAKAAIVAQIKEELDGDKLDDGSEIGG